MGCRNPSNASRLRDACASFFIATKNNKTPDPGQEGCGIYNTQHNSLDCYEPPGHQNFWWFSFTETNKGVKVKTTIKTLCLAAALLPISVNAATYNLSSSYYPVSDGDYRYFGTSSSSNTYYGCGDYTEESVYGDFVALSHGETVKITGDSNLYYCCDNGSGADGYWIAFDGYSSVPNESCGDYSKWVSLGDNKYCQATMTGTMDWCSGIVDSGIIDSSRAGECVYSGTCTTMTHCGTGYYKNGTTCTACSDGGTTSGYTNGGRTECYIPSGTTFSDDSGTGTYTGNCYWTE